MSSAGALRFRWAFFASTLALVYILVLGLNYPLMGWSTKLGSSSVRIKIARPSAIQSQLGRITWKSVTIRQCSNGRLRQTTSHASTDEYRHIDDFNISVVDDNAGDGAASASISQDQGAPAHDQPKRPPVRTFQLLSCHQSLLHYRHVQFKTGFLTAKIMSTNYYVTTVLGIAQNPYAHIVSLSLARFDARTALAVTWIA
jgi:hypothetical protein